jgi:hypothetical protein
VAGNHPPLGLLNSSSSGKGSEVEACAYCDSTLSSKKVDDFDSESEACAEPASPSFASAICSSYLAMPVSMSRNVAMSIGKWNTEQETRNKEHGKQPTT